MAGALIKYVKGSRLSSATLIFCRFRSSSSVVNRSGSAESGHVANVDVLHEDRHFDHIPQRYLGRIVDEKLEKWKLFFNAATSLYHKRPDQQIPGWRRSLSSSATPEDTDTKASMNVSDDTMPEDAEEIIKDPEEKKPGWVLKVIVALTVAYMAFHGFPMIGEGSIRHSLALLRAQDSIFKRSGASRLALFANTDDKRKSVVKAGGIQRLISMLEGASDDQTRRAAMKALVALAHCEEAVLVLREERADVIFQVLLSSSSDSDVVKFCSMVLDKLGNESSRSVKPGLDQTANNTICVS